MSNPWKPTLDVYEDKDKKLVTVQLELPGVPKDSVAVEIQDGLLSVSGQRQSAFRQNGYAIRERKSGQFKRSIRVPDGVNEDKIGASLTDGVLTITLPFLDESSAPNPKQIAVE